MNDERYGEIHVEALPAMRVARYRAVTTSPEEDAAERMGRWRADRGLAGPYRHFGFDTEVPATAASSGMRGYEVWTTVPPTVEGDADVDVTDVPGGSYAALTIRRPFDDPFRWIPAGWERLHAWVETNARVRHADRPWLEELVERDGDRDLVLLEPVG